MDLDKISVVIRPRNAWEGVDLGFAMARRWFLPLWGLWLVVAVPVYLLFSLLLPESEWLGAIMFVWWLKPLLEPPLLFWMSRAMFGDRPDRRMMLRQWWRIVWPALLANLTWRRLSPSRSFYMPVVVLEGLHGKARRSRMEILGRRQQVAVWLTFVGLTLETVLELSAMILIVIMIPEELRWVDLSEFMLTPGRTEQLLQDLSSLLAMSIIAPFYVAGGFALYLTRRSQLEGWDIELGFRRIMARRRSGKPRFSTAAAVVLAVLLLGQVPQDALAADSTPGREEARALITEILAHEDFGKKETETYWDAIERDEEPEASEGTGLKWLADWLLKVIGGFFKGFAQIGEVLLWAAAGLILAGLAWWLLRNRGWLPGLAGRPKETPQAAVTLFGLDVRPESLPQDIVATARALLEQGDHRGALSLLYRGILARFIQQGYPRIPASATENECLAKVVASRSAAEADYFRALTTAWIGLAYGHLLPGREQLESLCNKWEVADESGG